MLNGKSAASGRRLYRVLSREDWELALRHGKVPRCGSDKRDGFVHLSTRRTVEETAQRYFEPAEEPLVIELDVARLPAGLRFEAVPGREGEAMPHLYADAIPVAAVVARIELVWGAAKVRLGERSQLEDRV